MVLHKNKWDKKASRKHEQKLASKDAKALEEEKNKAAARRTPGGVKTPVVNASSLTEEFPRLPSQKKDETAEDHNDQRQGNESEHSSDDSDVDGNESTDNEVTPQRRKRKIQSNAWRYQEPEPEPGAEVQPKESDHEEEFLKLTRDKLKGIEDREAKEEELHGKIDIRSDPNEMKTHKGNVLIASRDEFKDVSEKIRKQKQAEEFRRRFGSPQSTVSRKSKSIQDESSDMSKHEQDLDDLLGLI